MLGNIELIYNFAACSFWNTAGVRGCENFNISSHSP